MVLLRSSVERLSLDGGDNKEVGAGALIVDSCLFPFYRSAKVGKKIKGLKQLIHVHSMKTLQEIHLADWQSFMFCESKFL